MKISIKAALCIAAAILYNSWPLGYALDSQTARTGLPSDLEHVGHPYNWLFVSGDILTAACLVAVAVILILAAGRHRKSVTIVAIGLAVFGLFTAVSALLPSECTIAGIIHCDGTHAHGIGLDATTSSIAALGLLVSMVYLALSDHLRTLPGRLLSLTLLAWSVSGLVFCYMALTNQNAIFTEDILLVVSGLALTVIGFNLEDDPVKPPGYY